MGATADLLWGYASQKPPLKGGLFDIHFHRRDAEHAEDLFNFLLSAETRLSEIDGGQGAESKNQPPLGLQLATGNKISS